MAAASPTTPFPLGAYLGNPNGSDASAEATFEAYHTSFTATLGAAPTFLVNYVDTTKPIGDWIGNANWQAWSDAQSPLARTMTPVVGLPLASIAPGSPDADTQYRQIAAGQHDATLQGIVQAYAANGYTSLVVRPGWEMNIQGPTFAGSTAQDQADWVGAYQHAYAVLHQAAAALGVDLTVVWNPSITNYAPADALGALYPGNGYVDAIGADIYADIHPFSDGNDSGGRPTFHDWNTGAEDTSPAQFIADPVNRAHYWSLPAATRWSDDGSNGHALSLARLIDFAAQQGKPLAIPETGAGNSDAGTDVADDAAFPQWLAEQLRTAQARGVAVSFVNLWDSNGGGNYAFTAPGGSKPQEAAAWAKGFGAQASGTTASGTTAPDVPASTPAPASAGPSPPPPPSPAAPVTLGSGQDAIVLHVAEDAHEGDAQYTVAVDGIQLGGVQAAAASRASGQTQQVTLNGNWGDGAHTVTVDFLNDNGEYGSTDRNLFVTGASFNGSTNANDALNLYAGGPQSLTVGTAPPPPSASAAPPAAGAAAAPGQAADPVDPSTLRVPGAHDCYVVASNDGMPFLQDTASGVAVPVVPGVTSFRFADGIGLFDPTGRIGDVARLYQAAFDRTPDLPGLAFWAQQAGSVPLSAIAAGFVASPEFVSGNGPLDDAGYVARLYQIVLGRSPDDAGAQDWAASLRAGATRGDVLLGFANSAENIGKAGHDAGDVPQAEAYRLYRAAFNRVPDKAGLDFWTARMQAGMPPSQVAQAVVSSAEFRSEYAGLAAGEFVARLYGNVLGRAPDAAGLQYWTGQLANGASQAGVLLGFSDSLENRVATAAATHDGWVYVKA